MSLKLPLYWSYNRVIQKIFKTVLIIQTVLIIETKEYNTLTQNNIRGSGVWCTVCLMITPNLEIF